MGERKLYNSRYCWHGFKSQHSFRGITSVDFGPHQSRQLQVRVPVSTEMKRKERKNNLLIKSFTWFNGVRAKVLAPSKWKREPIYVSWLMIYLPRLCTMTYLIFVWKKNFMVPKLVFEKLVKWNDVTSVFIWTFMPPFYLKNSPRTFRSLLHLLKMKMTAEMSGWTKGAQMMQVEKSKERITQRQRF